MSAQQALEVRATVHKVRTHKEESGWTVFEAYPSDTSSKSRDMFTAVGCVGTLSPHDEVILEGEFVNSKWGRQFQVSKFQLPDFKAAGLKNFICNHLKGIGPALGALIYDTYGDGFKEVMETDPERLLEVKGIGKKKLPGIIESWNEHSGKHEILSAFAGIGITPAAAQKILKRWENPRDAIRILNEDPYQLAWEIRGIGFLKADEIAQKKGFHLKHPLRVRAATLYALDQASGTRGHCFLSKDELFEAVNKLINPHQDDARLYDAQDVALMEEGLNYLVFRRKVVELDNGKRVYPANVYRAEMQLQANIEAFINSKVPVEETSEALATYEFENGITLHENQREAVIQALRNRLHIITGGPGTGKTTIIKGILATLPDSIQSIRLCAPTGKAAKRMEESTGQPATTIHRLLEISSSGGGFVHNKENPLDADLVIVDESSMLDVFLARSLTDAIKPGARLVLIGDQDQLPSVGPGTVLADLLACNRVPRTRLTAIFRQDDNSFISINAQAVLSGNIKKVNLTNETSDFFWMSIDDRSNKDTPAGIRGGMIQHRIKKAIARLLELNYTPADIQVLSPMNNGPVGVNALNVMLQDALNPNVARVKIGRHLYSVGDRVMQLKNNYEKEVFNGDQGHITCILPDDELVYVEFSSGVIEYTFSDVDELSLAFAITVHKSQGSESPVVIIPVTTGHFMMLQRNLVYTAITRAKKMCILAGEKRALGMGIKSLSRNKRNTFLMKG